VTVLDEEVVAAVSARRVDLLNSLYCHWEDTASCEAPVFDDVKEVMEELFDVAYAHERCKIGSSNRRQYARLTCAYAKTIIALWGMRPGGPWLFELLGNIVSVLASDPYGELPLGQVEADVRRQVNRFTDWLEARQRS
jgi:hypothetical protein